MENHADPISGDSRQNSNSPFRPIQSRQMAPLTLLSVRYCYDYKLLLLLQGQKKETTEPGQESTNEASTYSNICVILASSSNMICVRTLFSKNKKTTAALFSGWHGIISQRLRPSSWTQKYVGCQSERFINKNLLDRGLSLLPGLNMQPYRKTKMRCSALKSTSCVYTDI